MNPLRWTLRSQIVGLAAIIAAVVTIITGGRTIADAQPFAFKSQVEKMFAEHEQQMTEKMMNGMTEQFGEMHNELSGKMQAIEDQLGGFEIQHAAQ